MTQGSQTLAKDMLQNSALYLLESKAAYLCTCGFMCLCVPVHVCVQVRVEAEVNVKACFSGSIHLVF